MLATDPERTQCIEQEFRQRLRYTLQCFAIARLIEDERGTVEASLVRLRDALARRRPVKQQGLRLHPLIEMAISYKARQLTEERTGSADAEVLQCDIQKAAQWLSDKVPIKQGAPADNTLKHHVEALMALVQATTGLPVMARRDRDSVYDPHFADFKAQMIFETLHAIDPDVTVTSVVNIMRAARRKYAGKPMRFKKLMPAYGARVEEFTPNFPIYCP